MRISNKLFFNTFLFTIIPIVFIFFLFSHNAEEIIFKETLSRLNTITDIRTNQLENFFKERAKAIKGHLASKSNKVYLPVLEQYANDRSNPAYLYVKMMMDSRWIPVQNAYKYLDFMLVGRNGKVVYVSNPEHEDGIGKPIPGPDPDVFEKLNKGIYTGNTIFRSGMKGNPYDMIIAGAIMDDAGKIIGAVVIEIDIAFHVYETIGNNLNLGETGESLLVNRLSDDKVMFISPLRFDPDAALKKVITVGEAIAFPAQKSAFGENGIGYSIDYRGVKVMTVWRYMPVPGWGYITKVDAREILAPINRLKYLMIIILLIITVIIIVVSYFLSKTISDPILELHRGAEIIGSGDLDYKIKIRDDDEIGWLSAEFNEMTNNLKRTTASRNELENEINSRKIIEAELLRSNKELDDFAYIASHDLKEPLRSISNFSSFILEDYQDKLDEDGKRKLNILINQSIRMEQFLDALLRYSRIGREKVTIETINLNEVIDSIKLDLDFLINSDNRQTVKISFVNDIPEFSADAVFIKEIYMNLISNAIKYNDNYEKIISLGYMDEYLSYKHVFFVKDNGIGIQEKNYDVIFKIFKRLHNRDKYSGGSGAGLTIVKKLIEALNGHIWVESEPEKGTSFYFTINTGEFK